MTDVFALQLRRRYVSGLVSNIQQHFETETGVRFDARAIDTALQLWLEGRFDQILESVGETLTSPHRSESADFYRILNQEAAKTPLPRVIDSILPEPTIFNGNRAFSPERLGAMIEYISGSGREIYKTNLNKLLFYSDLTKYYLSGQGISGATYVNMPYGPVPSGVEKVIDELASAGRLKRELVDHQSNAEKIRPGTAADEIDELSEDDRRAIDWVLNEYGSLSSSAISELSHKEKAYSSTRRGEPIAYEYAKFFAKLPPQDSMR